MRNLKIGIIVAALIAAVVITVMCRDQEELPPDTPETKTIWLCASCNTDYEWTAKEVEDAMNAVNPHKPPLICPGCKQQQIYQALRCDQCSTAYFPATVEGASGKCPKCFPDAKPPPPPEEPEIEVPNPDDTGPDAPMIKKKIKVF